ncbi:hypothetical protein G9A89_019664 [Geosiphon pyriformis]|nr:hypothetical protein G9A89_019664 [Geosiphon pyriformis]
MEISSLDPELLKVLTDFSKPSGIDKAIPYYLRLINPRLSRFWFNCIHNPGNRAKEVFIQKFKLLMSKKSTEKRDVNLLEAMINSEEKCPDYEVISHAILTLLVTICYSSVLHTVNILLDLGGRESYLEELFKEQKKIISTYGPDLSQNNCLKMEKLDSFIKESMRLIGEILGIDHIPQLEPFTFKNKMQVPKGRRISVNMVDVHHNVEIYGENADKFDGFRFVNKNSLTTSITRDFFIFGVGRHACPGRFLAIHTIKYKFTTLSKERPRNHVFLGRAQPPNEPLVFINRDSNEYQ